MDHFDNCTHFEEGFGRVLRAHERKAGHVRMLPPSSFITYPGDAPLVVGITRDVLLEVAKAGEITVDRRLGCRPFPMVGSADIYSQISSLVTRGLIRRTNVSAAERVFAITDLGRRSLAVSV